MSLPKKTKKTEKTASFKNPDWRKIGKIFAKYFLLPAALYMVIFFVLSPHSLTKFSTYFYNDAGDGFQNVWNIWWVNRALTVTHQNPWFTTMLHWPWGVSLLPQTMNIFNGLMAIPFIHIFHFSLIQVYNFVVVFSFVMGGVTMFWLIHKWFKVYWVAIVAGIMFTFSSYHFAHALGHLQLVSLEWIPLFILTFWNMVERLRYRDAILAAGALLLVALCDYYYLFYCVLLGALWVGYCLVKKRLRLNRHSFMVFSVFGALCLATFGPLIIGLVRLNNRDPLTGFHDPTVFGMDILSPIIPGGSWYWSSLTIRYWGKLPYYAETSVFFGYTVIILLLTQLQWTVRRIKVKQPEWLNFWWLALLVFGVLSLGEHPGIFGHKLIHVPLPYYFLEKVFPTLKISGVPVRWVMMAQVAAIIIASFVMTKIKLKTNKGKLIAILGAILLILELRPHPLPLTSPAYLPYVDFLKSQPYGAVIDNGPPSAPAQLYNQTIYQMPAAFGYVTRVPTSVNNKDFHIFADLEQGRYTALCRVYKIRYVVTRVNYPMPFPIIYRSNLPDNIHIYNVKDSSDC